jgi:two-component system sensor histidine kinase QseC
LIDQLLALSRLEEQGNWAPRARIDLVPMVRQVMADMASLGDNVWRLEGLDQAFVWVDASLCRIVLRNLLDNAMRYAPQQAIISVDLSRKGPETTLQVQDSGPGMTPDQLARLGERFFRGDPHATQGSGLGWSIVQRIAMNQQLQVSATRSASLGGLCVRLVFTEREQSSAP